jgi:hypothetical protein
MWYEVRELVLSLEAGEEELRAELAERLGCGVEVLGRIEVLRRSIDARRGRRRPVQVLTVRVELTRALPADRPLPRGVLVTDAPGSPEWRRGEWRGPRPVVVGAGPAGLAAAVTLARAGARPLLIERGAPVAERTGAVRAFWSRGELDPESNVLFGEGGAGLFSDGKLMARTKDRGRRRRFLELLVEVGAPREILSDAEPHLGSDRLQELAPRLRRVIIEAGGEIRFHCRLDDLLVEEGRLRAVVAGGSVLRTDACILATGHSARDVYRMLARRGVPLRPKPTAYGVRVELPQRVVDRGRYGRHAGHPRLGPACFRLTRKARPPLRAVYTFCMCPGGRVIACAAEPGMLTSNGMSLSARSEPLANAAFLVPLDPLELAQGNAGMGGGEFEGSEGAGSQDALLALELQAELERAAFAAGGADYALPAQKLEDFLAGRPGVAIPDERSCSRARAADVRGLLPPLIGESLAAALRPLLGQLGVRRGTPVLIYGLETRSSSPVRILRDERGESPAVRGLYPAGEGSGYAGGIVSSAIDGMRAAEQALAGSGA